jgi:uncharacterized protein (TIGR02453 family)
MTTADSPTTTDASSGAPPDTGGPTSGFAGFPSGTRAFLRALRDHADRDWFADHRAEYLACYDRPAKALVRALGQRVGELSPDLHAEPRVGGSIFRVNRDRRFSPDATPYKGYIDLWIWEGERALAPGGLYLRITPDVVRFGVGARTFSRGALARYRRAVLDDRTGTELEEVVAALDGRGLEVEGSTLAGSPRGIDTGQLGPARLALLRHTALIVDVDEPAEGLIESPDLLDVAVDRWRQAWPVHRWLVEHVQG